MFIFIVRHYKVLKIGNISLQTNLFLAPMAGISDLPFRTMARQYGCALAYTEMVSAIGLVMKGGRSAEYLASSELDKPLAVQLFGADPSSLAQASVIAEAHGATMIDINMGCPVKKVTRTNAGAALLKQPFLIADIVSAVRLSLIHI